MGGFRLGRAIASRPRGRATLGQKAAAAWARALRATAGNISRSRFPEHAKSGNKHMGDSGWGLIRGDHARNCHGCNCSDPCCRES